MFVDRNGTSYSCPQSHLLPPELLGFCCVILMNVERYHFNQPPLLYPKY